MLESGVSAQVEFEKVSFLALMVVANLVVVTAFFTASVANSGPYETPYRLHMRYYNFALPIFYIIAAGGVGVAHKFSRRIWEFLLFGLLVFLSAYALYSNLTPYVPTIVDSPEVRGVLVSLAAYRFAGGLLLISLILWVFRDGLSVRLYMRLALPVFVVTSCYNVANEQRHVLVANVYDKAGLFAKQYLSKDEAAKTVVVGSDAAGVFRSLFHLDNPGARQKSIPLGAGVATGDLPAGMEWVLLVGEHALPEYFSPAVSMVGFSLLKLPVLHVVDFSSSGWMSQVRASGLSSGEAWGVWSDSDVVELRFPDPLPKRFELRLVAHAFGPNRDGEFSAIVGGGVRKFRLSDSDSEIVLAFDNPDGSDSIKIVIPDPISAKDLGMSGDERKLGIGLVKLSYR
ncbi:hypothetical protein GCM10027046_27750 [Uliginosibacterium flavum]